MIQYKHMIFCRSCEPTASDRTEGKVYAGTPGIPVGLVAGYVAVANLATFFDTSEGKDCIAALGRS